MLTRDDAAMMALRVASTGRIDADAAAWLVLAFRAFIKDDGKTSKPRPLSAHLRLPPSGAKIAQTGRNYWLRIAAEALAAPSPGINMSQLSGRLAQRVNQFERRMWPAWRNQARPPSHADEIDQALFFARQFSLLPTTDRGLAKLLEQNFTESSQLCRDDVHAITHGVHHHAKPDFRRLYPASPSHPKGSEVKP